MKTVIHKEFVAIDVETANKNRGSICQIGLAKYKNGVLQKEWSSYIDPEEDFESMNVKIHGIDEDTICDAPTLPDAIDFLTEFLDDAICVSHSSFDRDAINISFKQYAIDSINIKWVDSLKVARKTWTNIQGGYGLKNMCKIIGYKFNHHDALEDAKAAGNLMIAAMVKTSLDLDRLLEYATVKTRATTKPIPTEPNLKAYPKGALFGQTIVFTGDLSMPRWEAAALVTNAGGTVASSVTKKTTMLVMGPQDISRFAKGETRSSKQLKAMSLISKGQKIAGLDEKILKALIKSPGLTLTSPKKS